MEEFLVISWWNNSIGHLIVPEITTHHNQAMAEKEMERRKRFLGKNSRVILTKVIKEI